MTITLANGNTIDITPSDDSFREASVMGGDRVELHFEHWSHTEIPPGSSVQFGGRTYYVERYEDVTIVHRRCYEYTCTFHTVEEMLKQATFINPDDGRIKFSVTGTASEHLSLLVRAANGVALGNVTWTVGQVTGNGVVTTSYDGSTLYDALNLIAEAFGTEYELDGPQISLHFVQYNKSLPLSLSYGRGNGLCSGIRRLPAERVPVLKALCVQGGDRNINTSSNTGAYGSKTLHMPYPMTGGQPFSVAYDGEKYAYSTSFSSQTGYTYSYPAGFNPLTARYYIIGLNGRLVYYSGDSEITAAALLASSGLGHGEMTDVADLSDIYPHCLHEVTAVSTQQVAYDDDRTGTYTQYSVTVAENIDYSQAIIPGSEMHVIFQDGMLAGKEFGAVYNASQHKFTIKAENIDDELMPNQTFAPVSGDHFIVTGVQVPQEYIRDDSDHSGAEWDLARAAVGIIYRRATIPYRWEADLDGIAAGNMTQAQWGKVVVGGYVSLTDEEVQPEALLIRITGIRQPLNHPKWATLTLSEKAERRRRRRGLLAESDSMNMIRSIGDTASRADEHSYEARSIAMSRPTRSDVANTVATVNDEAYAGGIDETEEEVSSLIATGFGRTFHVTLTAKSATRNLSLSAQEGVEVVAIVENSTGLQVALTFAGADGQKAVYDAEAAKLKSGTVTQLRYVMCDGTYYINITTIA